MICKEQSGFLVGESELTEYFERLSAGLSTHYTKALRVLPPHVAGQRLRNRGIDVHGQNHWLVGYVPLRRVSSNDDRARKHTRRWLGRRQGLSRAVAASQSEAPFFAIASHIDACDE